jgi:cysteine desulfurase/selenocysteine lyase
LPGAFSTPAALGGVPVALGGAPALPGAYSPPDPSASAPSPWPVSALTPFPAGLAAAERGGLEGFDTSEGASALIAAAINALASGRPELTGLPGLSGLSGLPGLQGLPGLSGEGPAPPSPINPVIVSLDEADRGPAGVVDKRREPPGPRPFVGTVPVKTIRADFPILSERLRGGRPLVWLDNAATTQKPRAVIERLVEYYAHENSNVHRGAHELAARATSAFEGAREATARLIGAKDPDNIVLLRGTTEAINLVAFAFAAPRLSPGDEIILTYLEHHANIVPWQQVAALTGARLVVAPVDEAGQIDLDAWPRLFSKRTKIVSVAHVSNALGTVTPLYELAAVAKSRGVPVVVDAAQSAPHLPIDVTSLGVDFLALSGHKLYGPTGIGALYGTTAALREARPWQGGGNMIADVTFERTVYRDPPHKFEAGTANIAGAAGLSAAIEYLETLGLANIAAYEDALLAYGERLLSSIPGLRIVGRAPTKTSILSFVIDGLSNEEVAAHLSRAGIAVRAGHHCAQPIHRRYGLEGTVRPSLGLYNTPDELDYLAETLREVAPG